MALSLHARIAAVVTASLIPLGCATAGADRRIVVCRDQAGTVRLQDHSCSADQQQLVDRQAQRAALVDRIRRDAEQRSRMAQAARSEVPKDDVIELRHVDGALRDAAGRRWVRVDTGYIEISSGELVEAERVRVDARAAGALKER